MKKLLSYLFLVVTVLCMSSCDDNNIAKTLSGGVWEGEVQYGRYARYQYVDMKFMSDARDYARGVGIEYDYTSANRYIMVDFDYEVRNGKIYIDYADGAHVVIYNYRLSDSYFEGSFCDNVTGRWLADFRFTRYNSWRHDRYDYYRYAPETPSDTIKVVK